MNKFLLDERPLIVLPSLAKLVGVNGAIVLQQCHWICGIKEENEDYRTESNGHYWCSYTYAQWQDKALPWLSLRSTGKVLRELEDRGFLFSHKPNKKEWNHTKWYRVNYAAFNLPQNPQNSDKEETSGSKGKNFLIDKEETSGSVRKKLPDLDKEETSESFYIKKDLKKDLDKKRTEESVQPILPPQVIRSGIPKVLEKDASLLPKEMLEDGVKKSCDSTKKIGGVQTKLERPSSRSGSMAAQNSKQAQVAKTKKATVKGFVEELTNDAEGFLEWRGEKLKEVSSFYAESNVTPEVVLNFYAKKLTGYSEEEKAIAAQNVKDAIEADFEAWPGKNKKTAQALEAEQYRQFEVLYAEDQKAAYEYANSIGRWNRYYNIIRDMAPNPYK